ncbi:hypothetical protein HOD30_00525 [Candidatus Peregrinibacteria bacterium]|jgi:hypothetical protein|nr:hypothetical protein [Candidatus Peregrinibacteria bacterium]MBT4631973.1 hypothetical protein [Candidatus Peregrinibacteria bacterium]MBT5517083.1 hypothetical protein [Candidatus Peregrinibacteria bacterium]MBT5823638.1 hypothetical protein [Candidatus Peregrinibacteria bacterium]
MKFKLHALSAGLAVGVLWGLALFIWTIVTAKYGFAGSFLELITEVYPFFDITVSGAFWGLLWGFLDGFIGTYLLVWLYNFFVDKFGKK